MAAFFFSNKTEYIEKAQNAFKHRGFRGGRVFNTCAGKLLLYPKQMVSVNNFLQTDVGNIYCVGTNTEYFAKAYERFSDVYSRWNINPFIDCSIPLNSFAFTICSLYELSLLMDED